MPLRCKSIGDVMTCVDADTGAPVDAPRRAPESPLQPQHTVRDIRRPQEVLGGTSPTPPAPFELGSLPPADVAERRTICQGCDDMRGGICGLMQCRCKIDAVVASPASACPRGLWPVVSPPTPGTLGTATPEGPK